MLTRPAIRGLHAELVDLPGLRCCVPVVACIVVCALMHACSGTCPV